jgi:hypothetical protein
MTTTARYFAAAIALYLTLTMLPFPFNYIPTAHHLVNSLSPLMRDGSTWAGTNIFKVQTVPQTTQTGSGDTMLGYLAQFCFLIASLFFAALIVSIRKVEIYFNKAKPWLQLLLRYWLASVLIFYGISKFLPVQMSKISLIQLVQTYGDMSPMGVLWKSLALSPYYQSFTGFVELSAGLLLCYRATYLLGLTLGFAAFTQVLLLNLFYDVPVKLQSSHYLLTLAYLLTPYSRQFFNFFVLQKPTVPVAQPQLVSDKKIKWGFVGLKHLFIAYVLLFAVMLNYPYFKKIFLDPDPSLYGIYSVESLTLNNKKSEPLLTNKEHWQYVIFDKPGRLYIHKVGRKGPSFNPKIDTETKKITLTANGMSEELHWQYETLNSKEMTLTGFYKDQPFKARLKKMDLNEFRLWNSQFNWIQEYPNNK